MSTSSSTVITYESRLIDSGNARAIFKVTTTTTVTTAPSSPVGTVISESLQFEAVDYSELVRLAAGDGIHTISPLEFISFISTYIYLIEGGEISKDRPTITPKELDKVQKRIAGYLSKINDLPKAF
jgi:hypothetical protein